MENRYSKPVICKFCGKERKITIVEDDGMDYMGHERGQVASRIDDNGCDCILGRIEKEKMQINPMCMNCRFCENTYCTNKKELAEVSDLFNVGNKLEIKNRTRKCKYWELDTNIFLALLN